MKNKLLLLCFAPVSFTIYGQNVGIGNPAPLSKLHISDGASGNLTPFGPLIVEGSNNTYINLLSPDDKETSILFGKATHASSGGIVYNNLITLDGLQFRVNGNQTKMVIDKFGRIGIGLTSPLYQLHVSGDMRATGQVTMNTLVIATGGVVSDFLIKSNSDGLVGARKGYAGLGLHYMIAKEGVFPSQGSPVQNENYIGEIRLFSSFAPPYGWFFCEGQLLNITSAEVLFLVIGTTYGGDGVTTFRLPDLRDAVPVGPGTNWQLGERSN